MIRSDRPEWVPVFTGLSMGQFQELVRIVADHGGEQTGAGRRWGLPLAERVLLTVVYYRTNLTFRQIALLFGISKSAANRVVEHLAPLLVLPDESVPPDPDTVVIVDGTVRHEALDDRAGVKGPRHRAVAAAWSKPRAA